MTTPTEALAEDWASIDGKLAAFDYERTTDGTVYETSTYGGYRSEAKEAIKRLKSRGFTIEPDWSDDMDAAPRDGSTIQVCTEGSLGWSDAGFWHDGSDNHWNFEGFYGEDDRSNLLTAKPIHPTYWKPISPPKGK